MLPRAIMVVFLSLSPALSCINLLPFLTRRLARPSTGAYFSWQPVLPDVPGDKAQTVVTPPLRPTQTFRFGSGAAM